MSCLITALLRTIKQKERSEDPSSQTSTNEAPEKAASSSKAAIYEGPKGAAHDESQKSDQTFFNPAIKKFDGRLTPLMLKSIKAHECLCNECAPEFAGILQKQV